MGQQEKVCPDAKVGCGDVTSTPEKAAADFPSIKVQSLRKAYRLTLLHPAFFVDSGIFLPFAVILPPIFTHSILAKSNIECPRIL